MPVLSRARTIGGDGAFGIRDLGGYTTTSGQTVRDRTVYRADDLHRLPGADTPRSTGFT